MERRKFIQIGSWGIPIAGVLSTKVVEFLANDEAQDSKFDDDTTLINGNADYTIHIGNVLAKLAPGRVISTTAYNENFSGEVLRLKEGKRVTIDLINDTDTPEQVHWHGQFVPVSVDGSAEEGTPYVPARGKRRISFVPGPSGTRFVHTHIRAGSNLQKGTYSGQDMIVYIEPKEEGVSFDKEEFLMFKELEPFFTNFGEEEEEEEEDSHEKKEKGNGKPNGLEVGYRSFCINGKTMSASEPIHVKEGERMLFHFLNASATENRKIALPGHKFKVIALDGNPVPNPETVEVIELGVAERVDAIVEMNNPGKWILGVFIDEDREGGMARIIEYANHSGKPYWKKPSQSDWDYRLFGTNNTVEEPDKIIPMKFGKINGGRNGFNTWTINGKTYEESTPGLLHYGKRYRLSFFNDTDDVHPLHLHRHSFQLTSINGKKTSGILKDVVMIEPNGKLEVDFEANHPGNTLFHCHQQLHMDYGFMYLFQYASTNGL